MGDITEHFSYWEFACKCGCGFDCVNFDHVRRLERFRAFIQREIGREFALQILSGVRCPAHNAAIKPRSTPDSQHTFKVIFRGGIQIEADGRPCASDVIAADAETDQGMPAERLYQLALDFGKFNGVGQYHDFVHLDSRQRGQWRRPLSAAVACLLALCLAGCGALQSARSDRLIRIDSAESVRVRVVGSYGQDNVDGGIFAGEGRLPASLGGSPISAQLGRSGLGQALSLEVGAVTGAVEIEAIGVGIQNGRSIEIKSNGDHVLIGELESQFEDPKGD